MASIIKVDNVQNTPGTNIINKCSVTTTIGAGAGETVAVCAATVNLGRSGGTVNLTSGASQTGFGRTGTVDWDTSIHTGTVTAATGKGYFVNTTAGGITVNLPAAAVGSIVAVSDYASTAASNNITVAPNGSEKINGVNDDYTMSTAGLAVTLVYADATKGWKSVTGSDADATGVVPAFVTATGGTPCTGAICGNFKTHVFTGPGTFCVSCAGNAGGSSTVDYTVVAGGGGSGSYSSAAGGSGGFRLSNSVGCIAAPVMSPLASGTGITVSATPYAIAVGGGGAGGAPGNGTPGSTSTFATIDSAGGGGGKGGTNGAGLDGGSGGGGKGQPGPTGNTPGNGFAGGSGNTPPTSPVQGTDGGKGFDGNVLSTNGGGGGGAATVGSDAVPASGGDGGAGSFISDTFLGPISPSYGEVGPVTDTRYFAGGGGGGSCKGCSPSPDGGVGGGGNGGAGPSSPGVAGATNMGAGAGGAGSSSPSETWAGGSGIVILRYKFQ